MGGAARNLEFLFYKEKTWQTRGATFPGEKNGVGGGDRYLGNIQGEGFGRVLGPRINTRK